MLFWPWASGRNELDTFPLNRGGVSRAEISLFLINGNLALGMWKEKGSCVTETMSMASGSATEFATN